MNTGIMKAMRLSLEMMSESFISYLIEDLNSHLFSIIYVDISTEPEAMDE